MTSSKISNNWKNSLKHADSGKSLSHLCYLRKCQCFSIQYLTVNSINFLDLKEVYELCN